MYLYLVVAFICCGGLKTRLWHSHVHLHLLQCYSRWDVVEYNKRCVKQKYPSEDTGTVQQIRPSRK